MKKAIVLLLALSPIGAFAQTYTPVYESFDRANNDQLITIQYGEYAPSYEALNGVNFYVTQDVISNDQYTLYRCSNSQYGHFVSLDANCEGASVEAVYGYVFSTQISGTVPLNRYYSTYFGRYFVTPQFLANPDTYAYQGTLGYVYPGTVVAYPPITQIQQPNPQPQPNPFPFPGNHPHPNPGPGPRPQPNPQPIPQPRPPQPFPQPQPRPQPQPNPQPFPQPQPRPQPQPNPQPFPQPQPRPQPQPNPQPNPQPFPQPQPRPQPQPNPQPFPQPQPRPQPGPGGGGNPGGGGGHPSGPHGEEA